ncbi:MAG: polymer-forming cytoskeletal protein [Bryobacteraceae bacterium]|jgi:cytoskeletal protein CcmA (bactofilin family)
MGASPIVNSTRRIRCPSCGSERLQLRTERDHIDRLYQTPSDMVRRLFVADMQLYHCRVCRLQFYDTGQAAQPAVQSTAEAPRTEIATAEPVAADGTLIGQTVTIRGRLSSRENIVVEGEIEGDIEIPAHRVTIGMAGRMRGDVLAAEVVALGTIDGNVDARQNFALRAGAKMIGNIRTPSLKIEEGASFKGRIEHA